MKYEVGRYVLLNGRSNNGVLNWQWLAEIKNKIKQVRLRQYHWPFCLLRLYVAYISNITTVGTIYFCR